MKRNIVIATHGTFAKGIYESLKIIVGEQENVHLLNAFVDCNDIEGPVNQLLAQIPQEEELIVCTDVFGGSVNNEWMKYMNRKNFYLITGTNLPLLMQLFLSLEEDTATMIRTSVNKQETAPMFCNDLFANKEEEEDF